MKAFAILLLAGAVAGTACTAGGAEAHTVYAWSMALKSGDSGGEPPAEKTYRDYPEWKLLDKIWFCDLLDDDELAARESLLSEGEAAWEAMMAVVRECDNECVVGSALAILIESQGDKRAVVAELKDLFAKRLPQAGEVDEWTIYSMANAIAKMGGEEALEVLIPMLNHPRRKVRGYGVMLLSEHGTATTLAALEKEQAWALGLDALNAFGEAIAAIEKRLAENMPEGGNPPTDPPQETELRERGDAPR